MKRSSGAWRAAVTDLCLHAHRFISFASFAKAEQSRHDLLVVRKSCTCIGPHLSDASLSADPPSMERYAKPLSSVLRKLLDASLLLSAGYCCEGFTSNTSCEATQLTFSAAGRCEHPA